jgi:hypothetical protein
MKGLLSDFNIEGHVAALHRVLRTFEWATLWVELSLPVLTFADVGLPGTASDEVVWRFCQERELVLITANRNHEGGDSLEAVVRRLGTTESLPVMTIADGSRFLADRDDAEAAAEKLLDYLYEIDKVRGSGRLYIP